ncbi:probable RNA-binding protein 46 [Anabrus simplex]|uniref:probable RNA-binding protein 46 n=1 Tax=Anabrus simplex TaxID=316456 RepID=UPI0035A3CD8E
MCNRHDHTDFIYREQQVNLLELMEKTGYELLQTNGQRTYSPPREWNIPRPPKGSEIFIGKLPRDVFEHELLPILERVGKIYELRLMMDFSGSNRGFAFATFFSAAEANRAVLELDNLEIRPGEKLGVVKSLDNRRLFVGGLPRKKSKEDVMNEIRKIVDGVVDVILYSSVVDKTKNRGFAFIEFESHRAAAMARRKLVPRKILIWGQEISVDWAEPEGEVDEDIMSKVTVLYVRNLMMMTSEEDIKKAFEYDSGESSIERVKKVKDFAFVHFVNRECATIALERWNGRDLNGSKIEVTWAKPKDKLKYIFPRRHIKGNTDDEVIVQATHGYQKLPAGQDIRSYYAERNHVLKMSETVQQMLHYLGQRYNWGEPVFQVMAASHVNVPNGQSYICKIQFPHYPGDQSFFQCDRVTTSVEEAKHVAAEHALKKMNELLLTHKGFETVPHFTAAALPEPFPQAQGLTPLQDMAFPYTHASPEGFNIVPHIDAHYQVQI